MSMPDTLLLAELDGVQYLQLAAPAVLAVRGDLVAFYCGGDAWDASPAAREAQRRRRIAELTAELEQLTAAGPLLPPPPAAAVDQVDEPLVECPYCHERFKLRGINIHKAKCAKRPAEGEAAEPVIEASAEPPATVKPEPVVEASAEPPATVEPEPVVEGHPCPHCPKVFGSIAALHGHIGRVHVALARKAEPAPEPAPWACATCSQSRPDVEQALSDPTRCKACVRAANGAAPSASAALAATVASPKAPALPS